MKPRGIELPVGRLQDLNFFSALKFLFLTALLVLFLNVTFTLYANVSTRYYSYPNPPFLKITSSSTISFSHSSAFFSSSSSRHDPCSNSPPPTSRPSSLPQSPPPSSDSLPSSSSSSFNPNPKPIASLQIPTPTPLRSDKPSSSYSNSSLSSSSSSPPPPFTGNLSLSSSSSSPPPPPLPFIANLHSNLRGKRKVLVKGCDLSKGEWIQDPKAPYYTNSTCWTIQEHQNCMKYGRPNLDFLKWRWKPDGCELPLLEPAEFLEFMRGKNLAFIGDSLARNQMQSLMCLLSRVEYPEEIWPPVENVTQMFYKSYNLTIWAFWSPFLIRAEETTTNNYDMWNLYLDEPDQLWQRQMAKFDHIVLNTGNWYNRPAQFYSRKRVIGCHYCIFKRTPFMSLYKAHRQAFRTAMDAIVDNKQGFKGLTIVRTVSPSHFEGGEWNKGGDCRRTGPFRRGGTKLMGMDLELYKDQLKEFWKAKWEGNEKGLEFRLLDTTQAMLLRPDGHPSRYGHWPDERRVLYNDCVHWCLPGPVDMWNDLLFLVLSV